MLQQTSRARFGYNVSLCLYVWQIHSLCLFGWSLMLAALLYAFLCMWRDTLAMCNFSVFSCKHTNMKSHTHWDCLWASCFFSSCCIYNSWLSDFIALLEFHCVFLNVCIVTSANHGAWMCGSHAYTQCRQVSCRVHPCWPEVESWKEQILSMRLSGMWKKRR